MQLRRKDGAAPKVDPSQISTAAGNALCKTLCESVKRFFEDPENERAFERWKATQAIHTP